MTRAEYVDSARAWAHQLVWEEGRGPGDLADARRRVEARYGIPANMLKDLRYRPPKRIAADIYHRLRLAYLDQCERIAKSAQRDIDALKREGINRADLESAQGQVDDALAAIENAKVLE